MEPESNRAGNTYDDYLCDAHQALSNFLLGSGMEETEDIIKAMFMFAVRHKVFEHYLKDKMKDPDSISKIFAQWGEENPVNYNRS